MPKPRRFWRTCWYTGSTGSATGIPPETELVRSLGVSPRDHQGGRWTAGWPRIAGQGPRASGTFLARLPEQEGQPSPVGIKLGSNVAGLGRLETYTSIAERLGLKAESDPPARGGRPEHAGGGRCIGASRERRG